MTCERNEELACILFIYSFSVKGFLFLFLSFYFIFSFRVDRLFVIPLHNSSRNRGSFLSFFPPFFSFLFFLLPPSILGSCERFVHVSVIPHHSLIRSYPHGAGRSSHIPHKKERRSPTHKIGEWRILFFILLFHYMGGFFFFFFFLLACLLVGWFV